MNTLEAGTLDERIVDAIRKRFAALASDRNDWRDPHVSDVYGCDFATRARRAADEKPRENRTPESCVKMQIGNDVERYVAEGLAFLDPGFRRGERIAWNPATGQVRRGLLEAGHDTAAVDPGRHAVCTGCPHCSAGPGELIGHVDATVDALSLVLEIKSTQFYRGKAPTEPAPWYVEQTASYAVALGYKRAGIIIVDRNTGEIAGPFWLDLDAPPPTVEGVYDPTKGTLREQTIARVRQVLDVTDPEAFPPDPVPRYKWQPNYCKLGDQCACISKS